jgi:hypothetical protein
VEVPSGQTLDQQFHAVHLRFDAATAVVAAPSSPDHPAEEFRRVKRLVARDCAKGVRFPRLGALAGRYDRSSATGSDGIVTLAGVEGTIGGDARNLLIWRDLVAPFGQHGRFAHIAGGAIGGSDFQRLLINPDEDLAPDAPYRAAMLAGIPLPLAHDFDAGAVDQQV